MMKHNQIIDVNSLSKNQIETIFTILKILKKANYQNSVPELLKNQTLAMLFEEPSTRTRVSFEAAMTKLGGHAQYLKPKEIHLGVRESLYDTIKVLSRLTDGIFCRALKHETILAIAKYADVPVFNGLTDFNHPTQVIGDFFTMLEHFPKNKKNWSEIKFVFIGDATNVCKSLMNFGTKLGINFVHVGPKNYHPPDVWIQQAKLNLKKARNGSIKITDDLKEIENSDFIYTDLWWWVDQVDKASERYKEFMAKNFQINQKTIEFAGPNVKIMHCLPCSRNVELTDEIFDGPNSIIFDQSENKLYSAMALLTYFMYPSVPAKKELQIIEVQKEIDKHLILEKKLPNKSKNWTYNNDYQTKFNYLKDLKLSKKLKKRG